MQMILWLLVTGEICLLAAVVALFVYSRKLHSRLDRWAVQISKNLADTKLDVSDLTEGFKAFMAEEEEAAGEKVRQQVLLREMNDELERSLKQQKDYNDGIAGILGYSLEQAMSPDDGGN